MGLKTTNYELSELGITIPDAYAQIEHLSVNIDGRCHANFKIQTTRDAMNKESLDRVSVRFESDKSLPIYEQAYNYAKKNVFKNWEDDIVTDTVEEDNVQE